MPLLPYLRTLTISEAEGFDDSSSWACHPCLESLTINLGWLALQSDSENSLQLTGVKLPRLKEFSSSSRHAASPESREQVISDFDSLSSVNMSPCESVKLENLSALEWVLIVFKSTTCRLVAQKVSVLRQLDLEFEASSSAFHLEADLPLLDALVLRYNSESLNIMTVIKKFLAVSPRLRKLYLHGAILADEIEQIWHLCPTLESLHHSGDMHKRPQ
jgi:hypothetical protein